MKIQDVRIKEQIRTKAKKLPMCDSFMRYVEHHEKYRNCETLKDMLLDTFKWDQTREGQEYWQRVHDSIQLMPSKKCCGKIMKPNDFGAYYKCRVCKKIKY